MIFYIFRSSGVPVDSGVTDKSFYPHLRLHIGQESPGVTGCFWNWVHSHSSLKACLACFSWRLTCWKCAPPSYSNFLQRGRSRLRAFQLMLNFLRLALMVSVNRSLCPLVCDWSPGKLCFFWKFLIRLFEGSSIRKSMAVNQKKAEKLRCIINYFRRVDLKGKYLECITSSAQYADFRLHCKCLLFPFGTHLKWTQNMIEMTSFCSPAVPTGTVSFTRRALDTLPRWEKSTNTLTKVHGNVTGMIEDEGEGMLQVSPAGNT